MSLLPCDLVQNTPSYGACAVDEAAAIRRVQTGDVQAFNSLVVRYQRVAYNLAYRLLGDPDQAADVVQEAFLAAYRASARIRAESFRAWLLRIVANACTDVLRARGRRRETSLDSVLDNADHSTAFEDPKSSVEDVVLWRELLARVHEGLQTLPMLQRIVVVLADVHGFDYEEIARITGAESGTVKSRLSRGRARLRDFLREESRKAPSALRN